MEEVGKKLRELDHQIWSNPECAFEEHHAHDAICSFLESENIQVTRHAYGLQTAFEARSGNSEANGPLINFNAEYDALPGIGHACGHNLIATSSIAAFLALSALICQLGLDGGAQLLGTPAEENGGGKTILLRNGAYKDVAASLMAHGGPTSMGDGKAGILMNARQQINCNFTGKSAHAGATPWDGQNALDAFVSAYTGVSMLRQQIRPEERIHCALLGTPKVANVIPASTKACWQVRSPTLAGLRSLVDRVQKCIQAGALATGCAAELTQEDYYTDIKLNETLCELYQAHMAHYGRNVAKKASEILTGSTDAGNVSYAVPTLHSFFSIGAPDGSCPHQPSYTEAAGTDHAHDQAIVVGKVLALIGFDLVTGPEILERVQQQWKEAIEAE
ncbi:amidohydrolase [Penicillium angulare]|uniref:Peptidase M20 domain-containing protein 2 n=1 Tax=Penicillium angulare TaxID=116970 RepID=A0A9W9K9A1_9EURO|nr:amidohydrolase [Penicillium angulare]